LYRSLLPRSIAGGILATLLLPGLSAWGHEFRITPSLGAKDEYNSNVFFTTGNRIDSFILTVSPGLVVSDRTERMNARLDAVADRLFYTTDHDLDGWDQRYRGELGYRFSEKLGISGDASWSREGRPDAYLEETGLLIGSRTDRLTGSAAIDFAMGEKTGGALSYRYDRFDYQDQVFTDSEQHTTGLGFTHDLGRYILNTKARANLGYSRLLFTGSDVWNSTMTVGFSWAVHETWSVLVDVGGRYTRSEFVVLRPVEGPPGFFTLAPGTETSSDTGFVGNAALAYTGERTTGSVSFSRDVTIAPGQGGAADRTAVTIDLSHRGSHELTGAFSGGYYWNRSEAGQYSRQAIDERTVRARPALRYAATKNIDVEAAYQYTRVLYRQTDTVASQNVVYLLVALRYPVVE